MRERLIESPANENFRLLRQVLTGRGIRKESRAVLSGPKFIAEVTRRHPQRCLAVIRDARLPDSDERVGAGLNLPDDTPRWKLSGPLFDEIDTAGTGGPLLLLDVPTFADWSPDAPWPKGCTLFVPFQHPDNIGGVIRSAVAFGVTRIVLLKEAAHPFHPKAIRAAGPAVFQTEFQWGPSITELTSGPVPIWALSAEGSPIDEHTFPETFGLLAGLEGQGVPASWRGPDCLRVPMREDVESLNASVATAVALFVAQKRWQPPFS
jgi:tRNA(Leu) C34 or U34 (ribose-2'-O)-methylase TrmL